MSRDRERCDNGGNTHCWLSTGLDVVADVLSSTRRCVWCGECQAKPYGPARKTWVRVDGGGVRA